MPRFQTDDTFYDDPAVARAGTAAMGLYYRCGTYVAKHLLDGVVPSEIASQYGTPEWIRKLTDAAAGDRPGWSLHAAVFRARQPDPREGARGPASEVRTAATMARKDA